VSTVGENRIPTRMGDGGLVELTRSELRAEIEEGTQAAARRAKVPPLTEDELAHLLDIFASSAAFVSVEQGDQLILSCDGTGSQIASSRLEDLREWEATLGSDLVELYHVDYSYKAIKTIRHVEQQAMRNVQLLLTVPVQYGAMPNLGLYSRPDGPVPNWSELMPLGKIDEARASQEEAVEMAVEDMVFVGEGMWEAGADGVDFDTAGAAGDADFLATLRAVQELRRRCPDIGIELGMASEFVLGMHGELTYDGVRLAGLWPKDQMKLAAKAGATMFGPAINVNTGKSVAWNTARALTIVKPCCEEATIPVHMNVGMGVGGVPMTPFPPADAVSRVATACREVGRLDGL
jgi:dimethylamine---corrinoid protein Co-methyltransferase